MASLSAEAVAGDRDGGAVEQPPHGGLRVAGEPPHRPLGSTSTSSAVTTAEAPGRVEDRLRRRRLIPGRPRSAATMHRRAVGGRVASSRSRLALGRVRHEGGLAVQPQPAPVRSSRNERSVAAVVGTSSRQASAATGTRPGRGRGASRSSRPGAWCQPRSARRRRARSRPGTGCSAAARPSSSRDHGDLGEGRVRAVQLGGHLQAEPAGLRPAAASRRSRRLASRPRHARACAASRSRATARELLAGSRPGSSGISLPPVPGASPGRARR